MSSRSIVVVDDEDEKNKKDPIVDNCCGCCSLGAGCLLIAIIYLGLGVSFIVTRSDQLTVFMGKKGMIWSGGANIFLNIWRLVLITGMFMAVTSLIGCAILAVGSCLWGHKESYRKLRKSVIIWCVLTSLLITFNAGEVIYVVLSDSSDMRVLYNLHVYTPQESLLKMIIMAAVHAGFYIYFVIVLVSYLRLLKYSKISKLGGADYQEKKKTSPSVMEEKYYDLARTSVVTSETEVENVELPASPEDTTPERITPERITPEQITPERITSERTPSNHSTSDQELETPDPVIINVEAKDHKSKDGDKKDLHRHKSEETKQSSAASNMCNVVETVEVENNEMEEVVKENEVSATTQMFLSVIYDLPPLEEDSEDEQDLPIKIEDLSPEVKPGKKERPPDVSNHQIQEEKPVETSTLPRDLKITEVEPESSTKVHSRSETLENENRTQEKEKREVEDISGRPCSRARISRETEIIEDQEDEEIKKENKKDEKKEDKEEEEEMNEEEIKRFFEFLSMQPHNLETEDFRRDADPIEKMFRMFGGELCKQNPQLCSRYFKAYKNASCINKRIRKDDKNEENILHKLTMMEQQYQERLQHPPNPDVQRTVDIQPAVLPATLSQTDPFYNRLIMDTSSAKRGYQDNSHRRVIDDPTMGFHLPSRLPSKSKSMMTSSVGWRDDIPPPSPHHLHHHDFPPPEYDPYYDEDPYTCSTCSGSTYGCYDDYDYGMFGPPPSHHEPHHRHHAANGDPYNDFKPFPNRERWSLPFDPRDTFPMTSHHSSHYIPTTAPTAMSTPTMTGEKPGIWIAVNERDESDYFYSGNSDYMQRNGVDHGASDFGAEGGRSRHGSFRSDVDQDHEYVMTRGGLVRKSRRQHTEENSNISSPADHRRSSDPMSASMRGKTLPSSSRHPPVAPRRSYDSHPDDVMQQSIMTSSSSHNGHHPPHSFDQPDVDRFTRASSRNSSRRQNSSDIGLRGRVTSTDSSKTLTSSYRRYNHNDFELPCFPTRSMTSSHIRGQRSLGGSVTDLHRFSRKF